MTKKEALALLYEEIDFLYTRGILVEKKLGRTSDIFMVIKSVIQGNTEERLYDSTAKRAAKNIGL